MIRLTLGALALSMLAAPMLAQDGQRVISLGGSVTEIAVALGAQDRLIARDLIAHLERAGYVVDHARDGEDGWYRGDSEDFAAAILDLGLPSMDGMTILKR